MTQENIQKPADLPAYTVKQLAERWQCSSAHVYTLIRQRKLGYMTVGTLIRVRQEDVDVYEAQAFQPPVPIAPPAIVVHPPVTGADRFSPAFLAGQASRRRLKPKDA